jgi:RNA polymerase sigma factor (sigma-70 family)
VTRAEFNSLIARHYHGLVKFAYWLDGGPDDVHDAVARLLHTGAYLKFEEGDPRWLRRAVSFDVRANRAKALRRARLDREHLEEAVHLKFLAVAAQGVDTEDGFRATGDLELVRIEPDVLQRMVAAEEVDRLYDALATLPLATERALRLVFAEGRTWSQAGQVVGVGAEALRKRVARALPGLRERLVVSGFGDVANYVSRRARTAPDSFAPAAVPGFDKGVMS